MSYGCDIDNILAVVENILKDFGYQYQSLNGITGFRARLRNNLELCIAWDNAEETLSFIGRMLDDRPRNKKMEAAAHNVKRINDIITEGKFFVVHKHLSFAMSVKIKGIDVTHSDISEWVTLPVKMLDAHFTEI